MTTPKYRAAGLANLTMPDPSRIQAMIHQPPPDGVASAGGITSPEIEAFIHGVKWNVPPMPFSVTLNGKAHNASYEIQQGVIIVVSEHGTASASASGESNYAIAITLLFGILRAAD